MPGCEKYGVLTEVSKSKFFWNVTGHVALQSVTDVAKESRAFIFDHEDEDIIIEDEDIIILPNTYHCSAIDTA